MKPESRPVRSDKDEDEGFIPPTWDFSKPVTEPVSATVLAVAEHAVHFTFSEWSQLRDRENTSSHDGEDQTASLCPGRMYINGSIPLLKEAPTKEVLSKLLKEGMTVTVQVRPVEKPRELKFVLNNGETTAVDLLGFRTNDGEHRKVKTAETSTSRMVGWMVAVLWIGEKPDLWELNTHGHRFESHEAGFKSRLSSAHNNMFQDTGEDEQGKEGGEEEGEGENGGGEPQGDWFLVSGSTKVNSETGEVMTLPPLPASFPTPTSRVKGTVKELHRPSGGTLDCGEEGVFTFSRGVVYTEQGLLLGHTTVLETVIREGQEVQVDLYVGEVVGVYPGDVPEEQETHKETVMLGSGGRPHKVRVVELYADDDGRQVRGLATIQPSQLVKTGGAAASMVGEWVTFEASDLYFFGMRLNRSDLGLLLSPGDELYCQLDMLEVKEGRAQYRVKLGWIHRGGTAMAVARELPPDNITFHRHLLKMGVSFCSVEAAVLGKAPLKHKTAPANFAVGTICELEPAENNETVSRGLIKISVGPNKGSIIKFNRAKAFLFGIGLEKADLLYLVRHQEPVYCEISGLADYGEGEYVTQRVDLWKPSETKEDGNPLTWDIEERNELVHWLTVHNLTYTELKEVFNGTSPFRYFIPFPRDALVGKVICFDPVRGNKYGCTSGTILVESGSLNIDNPGEDQPGVQDMADVKITFHRSCFWVYGRKLAKADLSYLVQPNQRVMVECRLITDEDRAIHLALPQDIHYRATMIWIGPSRPRNDRDDPNRNDTGVFNWLGKRGMNINEFNKLVEGGLPPHKASDLDCNSFFLPAPYGEGAPQGGFTAMDHPERMPVLRHGPVVAHILDTAASSSGPQDPRLMTLLENDDMAQAAHHVSEALRYALQYYRDATTRTRGGFGMGFGRGYGGGAGFNRGGMGRQGGGYKRPLDGDYGGGYSRPPSKRGARGGWAGY